MSQYDQRFANIHTLGQLQPQPQGSLLGNMTATLPLLQLMDLSRYTGTGTGTSATAYSSASTPRQGFLTPQQTFLTAPTSHDRFAQPGSHTPSPVMGYTPKVHYGYLHGSMAQPNVAQGHGQGGRGGMRIMEEYTGNGMRSSPLVGVDQLEEFDPVYPSQLGEDKHLANEKWPQYLVPESNAGHFPLAQDVTGASHDHAEMYPYYAQPRQANDPSALTNPGQEADDFWALKSDSTQVLEEIEREGQKLRSRKHICVVCDKRFSRPSSLNTHMAVHTGAKPFQCARTDCGRRFSVSSNLRRHEKTHSVSTSPGPLSISSSPLSLSSSLVDEPKRRPGVKLEERTHTRTASLPHAAVHPYAPPMHSHSYSHYGLYSTMLGQFGGGLVSQTRQIPDQQGQGQGQGRGVATDFYQSLALGYDHPHHQFSTEAYVQPNPANSHQHSVSGNHGVTGNIDPRPPQHPGVSSPMSSQRRQPRNEHGEREEEEEGYDEQEEYDEHDEHDEQDEQDETDTTRP